MTLISFLIQNTTARKVYPIAWPWDITGSVLIIKNLINAATGRRND